MSTTAITNPVDIITQLAANQLTETIVAAATSKKSRKPTKAVVETSLVDEIHALVQSGSLDEVAVENLTRVFGREFVIDAPEPVSAIADEPKEKKPRAKKVKNTTADTDVAIETAEPKAPKEKKSRTKKDAIEEPGVSQITTVPMTVPTPVEEPKAKKTKTKKEPVSETLEENQSITVPALEEPGVSEPTTVPTTVEEPKAKKTKTKTKKEPVSETLEEPKTTNPKPVAVKKTKKPKVERPSTPVLVEEPILELTTPVKSDKVEEELDFSGFDAELVEEELSDIEDD